MKSAAAHALEQSEIAASAHQQMLENALQSAAAEREKLKGEMEQAFNQKLDEAASNAATEALSARKEFEDEIDKQRQDLENAKAVEIQGLKEELKSAAAHALEQSTASAKLEAMRSKLSQQITEKQLKCQQLSDDLEQAQWQQNSLQGELQDLKAKAATADQDKAAIMAATQDGEESSDKKLEDNLTKQRASFDEQMMDIKDRYSKEMQKLEIKIQATSEARNKADNNLLSANEELAVLQLKLSSMESKVQAATENLVKAEEFRQNEVAAIQQQIGRASCRERVLMPV